MRISDWSSDVCSSDLELAVQPLVRARKPGHKPVAAFLAPEAMASLQVLQREGIAGFRTPESCAEALALFLRRPAALPSRAGDGPALDWPAGLPATGTLTEYEAGQVFAQLGVAKAATRREIGRDHVCKPVTKEVF